jgi:hypothetical protein
MKILKKKKKEMAFKNNVSSLTFKNKQKYKILSSNVIENNYIRHTVHQDKI